MTDIDDDIAIRDALKAQEVQLRLFADNIPGPIAYLDRACHLHLRQPGVRELGAPAAGRDLRPHAVRGPGPPKSRRFCGRSSSARTEGEHVEYERLGGMPDGASAGCTAASRRTSTPTASCAGSTAPNTTSTTSSGPSRRWRRARSSCGCSPTTFPDPVVYLDDRPPLRVRQRRVPAAERPRPRRASSARPRRTCDRSRRDQATHGSRTARSRARPSSTSGRWSTRRAARAGCAAGWCRITGSTARSRASTSSATTSPTSRARRTRWRRARASSARSWTACRRRSPTSTATSAATTSTARSCSTSGWPRKRWRRCGCADVIGPRIYESAQAKIARALDGRVGGVRPAGAGRERRHAAG